MMPRVPMPAAPASLRKQGVAATYFFRQAGHGEDFLAVEIGHRHLGGGDEEQVPRPRPCRRWSRNFGSCVVPVSESARTTKGVAISV